MLGIVCRPVCKSSSTWASRLGATCSHPPRVLARQDADPYPFETTRMGNRGVITSAVFRQANSVKSFGIPDTISPTYGTPPSQQGGKLVALKKTEFVADISSINYDDGDERWDRRLGCNHARRIQPPPSERPPFTSSWSRFRSTAGWDPWTRKQQQHCSDSWLRNMVKQNRISEIQARHHKNDTPEYYGESAIWRNVIQPFLTEYISTDATASN